MRLTRIAVTLVLAGGIVHTQAQVAATAEPEFEVASVKPLPGGGRGGFPASGPGSADPGQFSWPGGSLRNLIAPAYMVNSDQMTGGEPAWIESETGENFGGYGCSGSCGENSDGELISWNVY